jgi:hypothetical protein
VGTKPPLQRYCIKRRKWQLLGNYVLHCKMIPQSMKLFLIESLREDVEIFMDLMKSFGKLSGLISLDPMDPSALEKYSFMVEVEPDSKSDSIGVSHTPSAWILSIMDFPQYYFRSAD